MASAPGRFWIIRYPESGGSVVAKFENEGGTQIPDEIADHDNFVIQEVTDRSALADVVIDQSELSTSELRLLNEIYPMR